MQRVASRLRCPLRPAYRVGLANKSQLVRSPDWRPRDVSLAILNLPESKKNAVFLSYASEDAETAPRNGHALRAGGIEV